MKTHQGVGAGLRGGGGGGGEGGGINVHVSLELTKGRKSDKILCTRHKLHLRMPNEWYTMHSSTDSICMKHT